MNTRVPTPIALGVMGFLAICVAVLGLLVWGGKDTAPLISFVIGIVPATIGVILISKQTDNLQTDVTSVKEATNGRLDRLFNELHTRLDAADVPTRESLDIPVREGGDHNGNGK